MIHYRIFQKSILEYPCILLFKQRVPPVFQSQQLSYIGGRKGMCCPLTNYLHPSQGLFVISNQIASS